VLSVKRLDELGLCGLTFELSCPRRQTALRRKRLTTLIIAHRASTVAMAGKRVGL